MLTGVEFGGATGLLANAATDLGTAVLAAITIGVMVLVTKKGWGLAKKFLG